MNKNFKRVGVDNVTRELRMEQVHSNVSMVTFNANDFPDGVRPCDLNGGFHAMPNTVKQVVGKGWDKENPFVGKVAGKVLEGKFPGIIGPQCLLEYVPPGPSKNLPRASTPWGLLPWSKWDIPWCRPTHGPAG
ncbi:hypothetical protein O181_007150 [Austropuccinia psidii MF-1]|uniref:Uncharacterized protein n=1 Tax=Austropuccinia psidii MF-1 TaxID=1389203 RepID=A0A9Q3BLU1_9BASI|nr:hypothetical protein [Austropuccinia psidii MF-1]